MTHENDPPEGRPAPSSPEAGLPTSDTLRALQAPTRVGEQLKKLTVPGAALRESIEALNRYRIPDPLAEFRALLNRNSIGSVAREMAAAQAHLRAMSAINTLDFRLPRVAEIGSLMAQIQSNSVAEWLRRDREHAQRHLAEAMAAIKQPYLTLGAELRSFSAAAELQSIGIAVREGRGFQTSFADSLRSDLGDWREEVAPLPDPADVEARTTLYVEQGLQTELAEFPSQTFTSLLAQAGLHMPRAQEPDISPAHDPSFGLQSAYAWLMNFELAVRRYLDDTMTLAFGPRWVRQRVQPDLVRRWKERQAESEASGMARQSLIDYADFMDYPQIITRADNWRDVFKPVFLREDAVRESFQRLKPVRNATMHAGQITQLDLLLMSVEIHRLMTAFRR